MQKLKNKVTGIIKGTILNVIVAFLFVILFFSIAKIVVGQEIEEMITILNYFAIDTEKKQISEIVLEEDKGIRNYPEYGTQYAHIKIDKINVDLPVYYGDTLEVLKKGVGHSSGSYFPGEGGSVVYMGHNSKSIFRRFSELQKDDMIQVTTEYGQFNYKIYDMNIINETDKLDIQKEEEILMIYTCYPFINIGYTKQRYVVYAKLV